MEERQLDQCGQPASLRRRRDRRPEAENGGFVQSADGISIYAGSTIFVDSTSAIEAGTAGGALAGYLTLDPNRNGGGLYGSGTVDANVIDNNVVTPRTEVR